MDELFSHCACASSDIFNLLRRNSNGQNNNIPKSDIETIDNLGCFRMRFDRDSFHNLIVAHGHYIATAAPFQ